MQELLAADFPKREHFALQFLVCMEVDIAYSYNSLWTDEAHFHLQNAVNTQNFRIWAKENPNISQSLPLHSPKVTVWCGFTAEFVVGPCFSRKSLLKVLSSALSMPIATNFCCLVSSFQHSNSVSVHTMADKLWIYCGERLEMIESSVEISEQPGQLDHLISIPAISGSGDN